MRVLITGDRNWSNSLAVADVVRSLHIDDVIIQGGAKGADTEAHKWALAYERTSITVPARWKVYGRAAGPIRNIKMLDDWKPDLVIYFHDNLAASKGTKHMVEEAQRRGFKVESYKEFIARMEKEG